MNTNKKIIATARSGVAYGDFMAYPSESDGYALAVSIAYGIFRRSPTEMVSKTAEVKAAATHTARFIGARMRPMAKDYVENPA
jgi:hypothetical protein